ncbi:46320_t:CDS:2 [Gigaspora margarita]|uniref:46320_t:CDS:1 n=1 Tax=Gigaspora margarita TaxID=4874 RepID=A0ABN7UR72_GIGMA|nr:46320_t:CDS:2 [Gigaspora margarita]
MADSQEQNEYSKSVFANNLKGLDAYSRHKKFMNDYVNFYGLKGNQGTTNAENQYKSEFDILKENHKFLRSDEDESELTWEQRLAKKYYDKLFKEYCIAELKYYKEGKIALRWRTEKEVIIGKGQLTCASTRCSEKVELKSWEVNFAYVEDDEKKNALVKIRLCPKCSYKLNYNKVHQEVNKEETSEIGDGEQNTHEQRKRKSFDSDQEQDFKSESRQSVVDGKKVKLDKSNVEKNTKQEGEFDKYFTGLFD